MFLRTLFFNLNFHILRVRVVILEHKYPRKGDPVIIENRRVLGGAVLKIENEVCSNLGIIPNKERDLALNYFLKLDCFHVGSLRMEN